MVDPFITTGKIKSDVSVNVALSYYINGADVLSLMLNLTNPSGYLFVLYLQLTKTEINSVCNKIRIEKI